MVKRIGEIQTLIVCLTVWVALVSIVLLISGNVSYLPGFLLGAAGSVVYAYSLYCHRIPALLKMRTGWVKKLPPIAAGILVILAVSHFSKSGSFLMALFGFFSFQISLLIYAVLIFIDQLFH
jgi:hypothetical protein